MAGPTDDPGDVCPECGESFVSAAGMMRHFGLMHPFQPKPWQEGSTEPKAVREYRLKLDSYTCQRCGAKVGDGADARDAEVHHLLPRAAGGPNHIANLVTLCEECHTTVHGRMKNFADTNPEILDQLRAAVCDA